MEASAIEDLAAALMGGSYPEAQPWDIGAAVSWIADAIARSDSNITRDRVRNAARVLNGHLMFEHTRLLGTAWQECQGFDPTITKHHAQALIDLSALDAAEILLRKALEHVNRSDAGAQAVSERLEYEGLLGRIDKQRFVITLDKDALVHATDRYLAQYDQPDRPYWHGINAVALLARQERERINRRGGTSRKELAQNIYTQVTAMYATDASDPWLASTASEASLALDDCDQAELWLYRFLHHPRVGPFYVNSYDRQLREIWQGSATGGGHSCADRLAGILTRHILRTQLRWSVSTSALQQTARAIETDPGAFEKNFSGETGFSVDTIKRMLAACSSIGCVTNTAGERRGTGYLVDGAVLNESFTHAPVFVTNAHVISDTVPNAVRPAYACVTFEMESVVTGAPVSYKVGEVLFTSPPADLGCLAGDNLDITIVRLAGLPSSFTGLPTTTTLRPIDARAKAYVVGHPRGGGLQISLHDSLLLDIDDHDRLVHYRTPTEPGSSGSPVFNRQWEVIAVHHGGSTTTPRLHGQGYYEANEGISLSAVCRTINAMR